MGIAFIDLQAQRSRISGQIDDAIARVLAHGKFIMGPEVKEFEANLAAFCGAERALGCANGTEALALPLMAWGVGPGDAVFCPSFTFAATAEVVPWLGASPVFIDILPDTYNIDPVKLEEAIEDVLKAGKLVPRAIIAVDLFGQPADYPVISEIARRYGLKLIADSAQSLGCTLSGHHPIHWADAVTTSFFPAKPLGCYGDGGAVLTDDSQLAETIDSLRVHGKAVASDVANRTFDHDPKYLNMRVGMNSRLDTLQAAILLEKLKIFPDEIDRREAVAARYNDQLAGAVTQTPVKIANSTSVWAQYTVEHTDRDALAKHLKAEGVPSAVYYPIPLHKQLPYRHFPVGGGALPVTDKAAEHVISLPMHPYLDAATQDQIVGAVRSFAPVLAG